MKYSCPICMKPIEHWEALCFQCWTLVKEHDIVYGTKNIQKYLEIKEKRLRKVR